MLKLNQNQLNLMHKTKLFEFIKVLDAHQLRVGTADATSDPKERRSQLFSIIEKVRENGIRTEFGMTIVADMMSMTGESAEKVIACGGRFVCNESDQIARILCSKCSTDKGEW